MTNLLMSLFITFSYNKMGNQKYFLILEGETMNIDNAHSMLVDVIKSSPEFLKLKQTIAIINKNPALKKELQELDLNQKKLITNKLSQKEAEEIMNQIDKKLSGMSKASEFDNYFNAVNSMNIMMDKINGNISRSIQESLK